MPELPEVETVRRGLVDTLVGRRLEAAKVLWPGSFDPETVAAELDHSVVGCRLAVMRRRGKVLIFDFDDDKHLLLHPMMTGQLVVTEHGATIFAGGHPSPSMFKPMPITTTRVSFWFSGDVVLFFNDQRKFGRIKVVDTTALSTDPFLARLGPEPLTDSFTPAWLRARLDRHPRAPVKAIIMDQSTVAGVGNIYADESLHLARLHPSRSGGNVTSAETTRLCEAIRTVLGLAVAHGGTSFADDVNNLRGKRSYLAQARVFRRVGQPCLVCGTPIERIRVAGRGTNICPYCQRS